MVILFCYVSRAEGILNVPKNPDDDFYEMKIN